MSPQYSALVQITSTNAEMSEEGKIDVFLSKYAKIIDDLAENQKTICERLKSAERSSQNFQEDVSWDENVSRSSGHDQATQPRELSVTAVDRSMLSATSEANSSNRLFKFKNTLML